MKKLFGKSIHVGLKKLIRRKKVDAGNNIFFYAGREKEGRFVRKSIRGIGELICLKEPKEGKRKVNKGEK